MDEPLPQELASEENACIVDSGTTHTILKSKMHFSYLTLQDAVVHIIFGSAKLIEGLGRATIMLPCGTKVDINKAIYSPKSQRNLLSFKDIRRNGYHTETMCEGNVEYLNITKISSGKKYVLKKLPELPSGLSYTSLKKNESLYCGGTEVH
jgi:hypothetical protein